MSAFPSPAHSGADHKPAERSHEPASDPSMEDILASIRRIIADDQALANGATTAPTPPVALEPSFAPVPPFPPVAPSAPEPRVLDVLPPKLQRAAPPVEPPFAPTAGVDAYRAPGTFAAPASAPVRVEAPAPVEAAPAPVSAPLAVAEHGLLSPQADASVASAFEALSGAMMLQNAPFMEETVKDLLRPMLKQWLDDNLPPLVERLVRAEIERVARGGR